MEMQRIFVKSRKSRRNVIWDKYARVYVVKERKRRKKIIIKAIRKKRRIEKYGK